MLLVPRRFCCGTHPVPSEKVSSNNNSFAVLWLYTMLCTVLSVLCSKRGVNYQVMAHLIYVFQQNFVERQKKKEPFIM